MTMSATCRFDPRLGHPQTLVLSLNIFAPNIFIKMNTHLFAYHVSHSYRNTNGDGKKEIKTYCSTRFTTNR